MPSVRDSQYKQWLANGIWKRNISKENYTNFQTLTRNNPVQLRGGTQEFRYFSFLQRNLGDFPHPLSILAAATSEALKWCDCPFPKEG